MRKRRELAGWRSRYVRGADGAIASDESVALSSPVGASPPDAARARYLAERYWLAVARASRGLVHGRANGRGVELRLLGTVCLLRLGLPETAYDADGVCCRYTIVGGVLARRPGGRLTLSERLRPEPALRAAVEGFFPRLGVRPYQELQHRLHVAVSRRFFAAVIAESPR
jgi:hypothetical protein